VSATVGPWAALAADATVDEIVGILIAVAPITGLARVVAAATPAVARSVGDDRDGRLGIA
jgi:alkylhydroperoxidase/carboxymuconolactone decarboxylase family protein YurZ